MKYFGKVNYYYLLAVNLTRAPLPNSFLPFIDVCGYCLSIYNPSMIARGNKFLSVGRILVVYSCTLLDGQASCNVCWFLSYLHNLEFVCCHVLLKLQVPGLSGCKIYMRFHIIPQSWHNLSLFLLDSLDL